MTDPVVEKALAASNALLDFSEELIRPVHTQAGNLPQHPVYRLMNDWIKSLHESELPWGLVRDWDETLEAIHQNGPRAGILSCVRLARSLRELFDVDEQLGLIASVRKSNIWSIPRSPSDWIRVLKSLKEEMSINTFKKRRDEGVYRVKPGGNTKNVSILLVDLPRDYKDSL